MYPVYLDLDGQPCLVVGGGRIALRKVLALLRAKARVTVISLRFDRRFSLLAPHITMFERAFSDRDIVPEYRIVIGATDDQEVNRRISACAAEMRIFCNIVDQPELCSFFVPAVVRRGSVSVAVATDGAAPRLSKYLKTVVAHAVGTEYGPLAACLAEVRLRLRESVPSPAARARFWKLLFAEDPIALIRDQGIEAYKCFTELQLNNFIRTDASDAKK